LASSNKKSVIRFLHVDDDLCFLEVSKQIISMENNFEIDNATSVDEAFKKMEQQNYDAVVSDYEMPQKNGLEFLKELREQNNQIPFILFTGKGREDVAVKALNLGADRYINKNGSPETVYCELAHAINKTVERKKSREILRESEQRYRELANCLPEIVFETDLTGKVTFFSQRALEIAGFTREELEKGSNILSFIVPEERERAMENMKKSLAGEEHGTNEYTLLRKNGTTYPAIVRTDPIISENKVTVLRGIALDITDRKKTEKALQESEAKFRIYVENSPFAVFVANTEGKYEYVNEAASKLLGYSAKELMGMSIPQVVFKEEHPTLNGFAALQETGKILVEVRLKKKDGQAVYVSLNAVKLPDGKLIAFCENITERKHAEEALKESEKRSRAIVANSPIGIATSGVDKHFLSANEAFCRILGYTEDELRKLTFKDITHSEDLKESVIKMCELENGRISSFMLEKRYVKKDGTVIDGKIMVSAVRNRNGKPSLFVAELEDITCARRVQDALMKSELQYRQLVNVAQEGIWALDSNYQTIFVNPRMAEMLGYAESEMVGKNLFEFVDKKRIEQSKQFLGQFKQGAKGHFDYEFTRKDGSHIYVSIAASVISDDEGKPLGTLAMVSDISYRKALETKVNNYSKHLKSMVELRTIQLKDANERLVKSERLAAIGELSGMVGHDLRNPLTGIKNAAYFLKKKGATISEAQAKEMLEIIDKAIDHSNKIINDLLDYSREMRLELTECEPRALLDEAVRMIQVPDRIQIVNHLLGETRIRVDADKMMRVFINLIKNAVDAMPEKGTLEITSRQTRDNLEIAFADTGVGIPEETLPKIFSPLFTTKAQGMGFGLAICKRIIESHEGTITVKTAASQGTTFTVTLPVKSKVEVGGEKTWINIPESLSSTTTRA
jgi:PAS domain S-box-containing protein